LPFWLEDKCTAALGKHCVAHVYTQHMLTSWLLSAHILT